MSTSSIDINVSIMLRRGDGKFLIVETDTPDGKKIAFPGGRMHSETYPMTQCLFLTEEQTRHSIRILGFVGMTREIVADYSSEVMTFCYFAELNDIEPPTYEGLTEFTPLWLTKEEITDRTSDHKNRSIVYFLDDEAVNGVFPVSLVRSLFEVIPTDD